MMHSGRFRVGSTVSRSHSVKRDATDPPNAAPVMITCSFDSSKSSNCKNHTFLQYSLAVGETFILKNNNSY